MSGLDTLRQLVGRHARNSHGPTAIEGLTVTVTDTPTSPRAGVAEPSLGLVVQGRKRTVSGDRVFDYAAGQFLIAQLDLPVVGQVTEATAERPFLGIGIRIEPSEIAAMLLETAATRDGTPWRLDNGHVRWLSVDLPATLELRRRVLPEGPRQRSQAGSALDLDWLGQLDPASPVLVTAQGLLTYFQRNEVHELIAAIAERLPSALFVFDVVPEKMLELVQRMRGRERDQAVELWSWLFSAQERAAIGKIPGVAGIRDLAPPRAPGVVPLTLREVRRLPQRVRYALPVFPVLQLRFQ